MGINIFLLKHTNKKMTSFLMIIFALLNFEKNNNANWKEKLDILIILLFYNLYYREKVVVSIQVEIYIYIYILCLLCNFRMIAFSSYKKLIELMYFKRIVQLGIKFLVLFQQAMWISEFILLFNMFTFNTFD